MATFRVGVLLGATLCSVVGACGGRDDGGDRETAVVAVVESHLRAIDHDDFAAACAQLSPGAQRGVVRFVARGTGAAPRLAPRSCVAAYGLLQKIGSLAFARAGVMDLKLAQSSAQALPVEVLGFSSGGAIARVGDSAKTVQLEESDGEWKIARLDFTDVP